MTEYRKHDIVEVTSTASSDVRHNFFLGDRGEVIRLRDDGKLLEVRLLERRKGVPRLYAEAKKKNDQNGMLKFAPHKKRLVQVVKPSHVVFVRHKLSLYESILQLLSPKKRA